MLNRVFPLLFFSLFLGCTNEPSPTSAVDTGESMARLIAPPPGSNYRVFESYESLSPMLQLRNDTTYVINFWATWCKPCITEMPHFQQLATAYQDKLLKIVLISLDDKADAEEKLSCFVEQHALNLPIVILDAPNKAVWQKQIDKRWDGTLPATLIYKNQLRFFANQAFSTYFDLEQMVRPLVK